MLSNKVSYEDFAFRKFKKTSLSLAVNTKADSGYRNYIEDGSITELIENLIELFNHNSINSIEEFNNPCSDSETLHDLLLTS